VLGGLDWLVLDGMVFFIFVTLRLSPFPTTINRKFSTSSLQSAMWCYLASSSIHLISFFSFGGRSWDIPMPLNFSIGFFKFLTFDIISSFISRFLNDSNKGR